ncbi:MAG: helix-turn-helix domain-containing protein [Thermoleophilia bacterium]|nr:helix-turn-helix domain-containing protein [Thermoleophilia bacterium]
MSASSVAAVVRAAERVRGAEQRLRDARAELRATIVAAHAHGTSFAAIARALGVTRQRVAQIVHGPDPR